MVIKPDPSSLRHLCAFPATQFALTATHCDHVMRSELYGMEGRRINVETKNLPVETSVRRHWIVDARLLPREPRDCCGRPQRSLQLQAEGGVRFLFHGAGKRNLFRRRPYS